MRHGKGKEDSYSEKKLPHYRRICTRSSFKAVRFILPGTLTHVETGYVRRTKRKILGMMFAGNDTPSPSSLSSALVTWRNGDDQLL